MTLDQQIQVWNTVGTWLAAIATFLAVLVSLYLAQKSDRVNLRASAGIRMVFAGDGSPPEEHVGVNVVNLGDRPVNVTAIGWRIGSRRNKRFCIQPVAGHYTHQYPKQLAHGEQATFMVSFKAAPDWARTFATDFVKDVSDRNLKTLRALVSTSVGRRDVEVVPEKSLLDKLRSAHAG
jgi:hypothetical protein